LSDYSKREKERQIKEILRLRLIESCTYVEITRQIGVSRPTVRKYVDWFTRIASREDMALMDTYKSMKRRVPFPVRWNKYVKIMVDSYARHPKRVATSDMRKKILLAATSGLPPDSIRSAMETYRNLRIIIGSVPSYELVAKVLREYKSKLKPPTT